MVRIERWGRRRPAARDRTRPPGSHGPALAAKLVDVVGRYLDPPAHAVVLPVDERSRIQALERTRRRPPIGSGRAATMTHDHERHGTTTLFAALEVAEGRVIGRCMQRHRRQEFLRLLNAIDAAVRRARSCA